MLKKESINNNICGNWRIVWMEMWDDEYINCVVPGYIKIDPSGNSEFQFGIVSGSFHSDPNQQYFDSRWEGENECDEARGDIEGAIECTDQKEELCGVISFWDGDESEYKAIRV